MELIIPANVKYINFPSPLIDKYSPKKPNAEIEIKNIGIYAIAI